MLYKNVKHYFSMLSKIVELFSFLSYTIFNNLPKGKKMAYNYWSETKVKGATPKETALLQTLTVREIANETGVSAHMCRKFIKGMLVPEFVRDQIIQFLHKKSNKLEKMVLNHQGG